MATVKYAVVQNAQYKVKHQSVHSLPTHGGISGWFGLGIWLNTRMVQQNLNPQTVTHTSTNRALRPCTMIDYNALYHNAKPSPRVRLIYKCLFPARLIIPFYTFTSVCFFVALPRPSSWWGGVDFPPPRTPHQLSAFQALCIGPLGVACPPPHTFQTHPS